MRRKEKDDINQWHLQTFKMECYQCKERWYLIGIFLLWSNDVKMKIFHNITILVSNEGIKSFRVRSNEKVFFEYMRVSILGDNAL